MARNETQKTDQLMAWNTSVAAALSETDKLRRLVRICDAVKTTVDICFSAAFVFHRQSAPSCIFDEVEDTGTDSDYVKFAYLLDPIYDRFLSDTLPEYCLMRDIAPDGFLSSEYFKKYYGQLGIHDEFYFNMKIGSGAMVHITFTRVQNRNRFTASEQEVLRALEPIVRSIVDDYWAAFALPLEENASETRKTHGAVTHAFQSFGASVLTEREREIVQLMLKGFSDKSTARILEISPGTVRNHKKSIFVKMDVTSQGQVFGLFLDTLANSEPVENRL